ncbi:MAG: response regulator [Bacteroidales bacterium]|jgi:CheY-like chemotaxis protein
MSLSFNNLELLNKKIIIIEDDIPSIKYYETLLTNSGASVKVFNNGKDFINYLEAGIEKIDLVIIDFLIPFINGIECTRIFRRENKNVPVLMVTAYFSEQTKNEALIAGCNEYILKPVFPEKIFCLLEKYLRPQVSYSPLL